MLSTVCASYIIKIRLPQNAFVPLEAQHKVEKALVPMLHHDLQSAYYPALLTECCSSIHTK